MEAKIVFKVAALETSDRELSRAAPDLKHFCRHRNVKTNEVPKVGNEVPLESSSPQGIRRHHLDQLIFAKTLQDAFSTEKDGLVD